MPSSPLAVGSTWAGTVGIVAPTGETGVGVHVPDSGPTTPVVSNEGKHFRWIVLPGKPSDGRTSRVGCGWY